jgi:hypothetical protein
MQTNAFNNIQPFVISDHARFNQRAIATRNRKFPIIGQTKDVNGDIWDIREVRTTEHGFDLHFGNPANDHGAFTGGLPRLIDTPELYNFWNKNRLKGNGFLFHLPAGRTTLKRARRRLGFNFDIDMENHWTGLLPDLSALPSREFAAKYGVKPDLARARRTKMLGKRARPLGWWRTPETIRILLDSPTNKSAGQKLGISTSQVHRLRIQARALSVDNPVPVPTSSR